MSDSKPVRWIKNFLFGGDIVSTPIELKNVSLQLQSKGIDVVSTMQQGGFTMKWYDIAGDLEKLVDYFDKNLSDFPVFRTRLITSIFNQLIYIFDRPKKSETFITPCQTDSEILNAILHNRPLGDSLSYKDATFWGNVAHELLNHRRPAELMPLSDPPLKLVQNLIRLYDLTCKTLGKITNPFEMVLVPRHTYVDSLYWDRLETFLKLYPDHPLTKSVHRFVNRTIDSILVAKLPTFCHNEKLKLFLQNVNIVHDTVEKVNGSDVPPKVIDVFHRLLALSGKDFLWQTTLSDPPIDSTAASTNSMELYHLYEKIALLEKQNSILLNSISNLTT